jgi:hypothetical protein
MVMICCLLSSELKIIWRIIFCFIYSRGYSVPMVGTWSPVRDYESDPPSVKSTFLKRNRPWRPIRLWDVEAPTFSRQLAHRWRLGCQPYAPAAFYPHDDSWYSFLLEAESTRGPYCGGKQFLALHISTLMMETPYSSLQSVFVYKATPRNSRTGWSRGNAVELYSSGGARFKSLSGHGLSWQDSCVFPQSL